MTSHSNTLPPAIFLMGPTASGKTALAVELVERYPCEVISVDSALVYRDMNIGTAKPDQALLARAPHRLIDIRDPAEPYSAANFREDALREMVEITAAGKIPLLVGGTMMYFKFLRDGAAELPQADDAIRQALLDEAQTFGWPHMHQLLAEVDPTSAERLEPMDQQRIQRALEVYRATGKTLTQYWKEQDHQPLPYQVTSLAVMPNERKVLHQRIAQRFEQMLSEGFLDEVKRLYERGDLNEQLPAIRAVGYKQAWQHIAGELSYPQMVERGIIATRQLAKRQITWLRSWPELHWLDSYDPQLLSSAVNILQQHGVFLPKTEP